MVLLNSVIKLAGVNKGTFYKFLNRQQRGSLKIAGKRWVDISCAIDALRSGHFGQTESIQNAIDTLENML
jgi:hypothetical protein